MLPWHVSHSEHKILLQTQQELVHQAELIVGDAAPCIYTLLGVERRERVST